MTNSMHNAHSTVVGVFTDKNRAQQAINDLKNAGFNDNQIGYIVRQPNGQGQTANTATTGTSTNSGNMGADVTGGVVGGGIIGGLIGAGAALLIPGFGPAIAGGILAATLGGAAIGAVGGGIIGALMDMGVPENEARYYQGEFEAGRILVTVQAGNRAQEAENILRRDGAYNAHTRPAAGTTTTTATTTGTTNAIPSYSSTGNMANYGTDWNSVAPQYRDYWQQNYSKQGGRWEDNEPGYRYAWESARNPNYQGRSWNEVEPQFRQDWEKRYPNQPWGTAGNSVRQAWEYQYSPNQQTGGAYSNYNQSQTTQP